MQLLKFKSAFSIALIAFVMGITLTLYLFNGCHQKPVVPTTKQISRVNDSIKNYYAAKIVVLQKENKQLQSKLDAVGKHLPAAKQKVKKREQQIRQLTSTIGYPAKDLLRRAKAENNASDTPTGVSPCDSLSLAVTEYMEENNYKDSLYEEKILLQDSLITLKDEIIATQAKYLVSQDSVLQQSLAMQHALANENRSLHKKIKRRRFGSGLATIGIAIASVFATNYINNHP